MDENSNDLDTEQQKGPRAHRLQRLTVTYSAKQDRLQLNAATDDDSVIIYWISRRMLRIFLPPLFKWLEEKQIPEEAAAGPVGGGKEDEASQAKRSFAQSAAQSQMSKSKPVVASEETKEILLTSIDIKAEDTRFLLILPIDDGNKGVVPFTPTNLAQWLGVVYHATVQADWAVEIWPSWFTEAQRMSRPGAKVH